MEAPDWPVDDTDSAATLTVTFTLTLTGGSSSDFFDVAEVVLVVEGLLIFASALILLAVTAWFAGLTGEAAATVWFAFSAGQFVETGGWPLADEEGEWDGEREGDGEGEIDGDGDVWGGSRGIVIHAWLRMSSRWGLLCGRTFRHCLIISWHSAKNHKNNATDKLFVFKPKLLPNSIQFRRQESWAKMERMVVLCNENSWLFSL